MTVSDDLSVRRALLAFVNLAEQRKSSLGGLSDEMEKCLQDGRAALTRQPVAGESEALRAVLYRIAMGAEPAQKIANDALAATPTDGGEG